MNETDRTVILQENSATGRWSFTVYTACDTRDRQCLLVDIKNLDHSAGLGELRGAGFGPYPSPSEPNISLRWDLPDNVCGIYSDAGCYFLFRCGAGRRRTRWNSRLGPSPFREDEIAWFCAKTHIQFKNPGNQQSDNHVLF